MASTGNNWLLWLIYLGASSVFLIAFWRLTRFQRAQWLSYWLRATMIALVFTPWYANPQETVMAPALMVVALDSITIGGAAAARGLVPLALALVLAWIVGGILQLLAKKRKNKNHIKQEDKEVY